MDCRFKLLTILLPQALVIFVIVEIVLFQLQTKHQAGDRRPSIAPAKGHTKRVLFYTSFFGDWTWAFGTGREAFSRCPVTNCLVTSNRSMLKDISGEELDHYHNHHRARGSQY